MGRGRVTGEADRLVHLCTSSDETVSYEVSGRLSESLGPVSDFLSEYALLE